MMRSQQAAVVGRVARQVLRFDRSHIEPAFAVRCAVGVAIPLGVAVVLRRPEWGVAAAAGALSVGFSSLQGVYRSRAGAMLITSAGMAISTFVGGIAGVSDLAMVVTVAVWGFIYGVLASLGASAASVGLNSVLALIVFGAFRMTPLQALDQSGLLLAGGLLQTLLLVVVWPFQRFTVERSTLAAAYRQLALYDPDVPLAKLRSPDTQTFIAVDQTLADPQPFARRGEISVFQELLDEAERIRGSLATLATEIHALSGAERSAITQALATVSQRVRPALDEIARTLRDGRVPRESSDIWSALDEAAEAVDDAVTRTTKDDHRAALSRNASTTVRALLGQVRTAWRLARAPAQRGGARAPVEAARWSTDFGDAMQTLRAALVPRSVYFRHAVRLAAVLTLASTIDRFFPLHQGYWVPMTALLVLRPDYSTTFTRGVARVVGTALGALLATAIALSFHASPLVLAVLVTVFAFVGYLVISANYALYTISVTSYVVFLLALVGQPEQSALMDRVGATLIGGILALASYVVWPTWERGRVRARLAAMMHAQSEYANLVLSAYVDSLQRDDDGMRQAQRSAWVERANAEASTDRMLNEPVHPRALDARGALGILAASRRYGIAGLALQTHLASATQGARPWLADFAEAMRTAADTIVSALHDDSVPKNLPPLRDLQHELVRSADEGRADADILFAETDLMVDALNTIAELIRNRRQV